MFHVEQCFENKPRRKDVRMKAFLDKNNITGLSLEQQLLLEDYANAVHDENSRYNLTGHRAIEEIMEDLICRSISPLRNLNVPRGTFAADLGSGSGVPGVPLAIVFPDVKWTLFDSNHKKMAFVNSFAKEHSLGNVKAVAGRIEELAHDNNYRLNFEFIVSRAMAGVYICAELGTALLKKNGSLYLYSVIKQDDVPEQVRNHCADCGLAFAKTHERETLGIAEDGLLFVKRMNSKDGFPRRFPVIKRAAAKAENPST